VPDIRDRRPPVGVASPDPYAVNLASPTIARMVSALPHDPRSQQPWNPEPLAVNYKTSAPSCRR
jgi:hypothetical protein